MIRCPGSLKYASSEESVGDVGLGQSAKSVIQRDFRDVESAEAVGFSHGQFGLVVETLDHTAGELLPGVSREWGDDDTGGTLGRIDSRLGERGCDGYCG